MEIKEFAEKVQNAVERRIGEEYQVRIQEVPKNNNIILQGLVIIPKNQNVSPTIYLNSFWDAYKQGIPFSVIIEYILHIFEEDTPKKCVDMSFFKEYDRVKERICYRLISAERNRELLKKIPHLEYLDLAVCFYYAYQGETLGNGSILIYNTHMNMWNTNKEALYELAKINTSRLFPWESTSMETTIREMIQMQREQGIDALLEEEEQQEFFDEMPMQILSNESRVHGAACILYPGLLGQLADREGKNLYVIPSSIHEVIVLPDSGQEDASSLREMVVEVNATQVEPEEILSDNVYYYDRLLGQMKIV